jgi:hypothetical protein
MTTAAAFLPTLYAVELTAEATERDMFTRLRGAPLSEL